MRVRSWIDKIVHVKPTLINWESPSIKIGQPTGRVKMKRTDLAYLAGTMDSDGCISIQKYSNCKSYRLVLQVVQRDLPMIEHLYNNFGGSVCLNSHKRKDRVDFYFRWMATDHSAYNLLKQIYPYLILKKKQADIAFMLYDEKFDKKNRVKQNYRFSDESIEKQRNLFFDIKKLNSPATTECDGSLSNKEKRQSELTQMKNRQRENRSVLSA
jgi:hypothetical protein